MRANRGYYDIELELDEMLLNGGMIDEMFYLQDLKQRKLFLNDDITAIPVWIGK